MPRIRSRRIGIALLVVRLLLGWLAAAGFVLLAFTSVETSENVIDCGTPASWIAVDKDHSVAPPERRAECQREAGAQVFGGLLLFGLPAVVLLAGPRARRWARARDDAEIAAAERGAPWRIGVLWRCLAIGTLCVFGAGLLAALLLGGPVPAAVAAFFVVPFGAYLHRTVVYPSARAQPDGLCVRNPVRRSFVSWDEVERVVPGYWGLTVITRSGRTTNVWVGQTSNWSQWSNRRTRGDRMAAALVAAAAAHQQRPVERFDLSAEERAEARRSNRRAAFIMALSGGVILLARVLIRS